MIVNGVNLNKKNKDDRMNGFGVCMSSWESAHLGAWRRRVH